MKKAIILLMTATISPVNCPGAQFTPDERRCRYRRALLFYLRRIGRCGYQGIVFVENSDSDLGDFKAMVPDELRPCVEFLSPPSRIFNKKLGKNNEFPLIDYAVDHSRLLNGGVHGFFKVTGRYYFRNIGSLVRDVRKEGAAVRLFCDQKDHRLYSRLGIKKEERDGETRFFFCTVPFWRENFHSYFARNPSWRRVEDIMFEVAVKHYGDETCRFRFAHQPLLGGCSFGGNQGGVICFGVKFPPWMFFAVYWFRWLLETIVRKVLPSFWF